MRKLLTKGDVRVTGLAEALRDLHQQTGFTWRELSQLLGVSQTTVQRIAGGRGEKKAFVQGKRIVYARVDRVFYEKMSTLYAREVGRQHTASVV